MSPQVQDAAASLVCLVIVVVFAYVVVWATRERARAEHRQIAAKLSAAEDLFARTHARWERDRLAGDASRGTVPPLVPPPSPTGRSPAPPRAYGENVKPPGRRPAPPPAPPQPRDVAAAVADMMHHLDGHRERCRCTRCRRTGPPEAAFCPYCGQSYVKPY